MESLERHPVEEVPGLVYQAAGQGKPLLVILNAIGQGIAIWLPLVERLSPRRRVLVWGMRQLLSDGRPVTFAEHCDDLRAVLQQENAATCDLLGWCTGAKLAARYSRLYPRTVQSMVFLGGSFKHPHRPAHFDTAYERNLEVMCRAIVARPAVAERLRQLFAPARSNHGSGAPPLTGLHPAHPAPTILPPELDREVRRPFRDAATLTVYAQQHVEFWSHDETATAARISVPVLGIAGERDEVVSPSGFQHALSHFPRARYAPIAAATHYCMYERPDLVADLIEHFAAQT